MIFKIMVAALAITAALPANAVIVRLDSDCVKYGKREVSLYTKNGGKCYGGYYMVRSTGKCRKTLPFWQDEYSTKTIKYCVLTRGERKNGVRPSDEMPLFDIDGLLDGSVRAPDPFAPAVVHPWPDHLKQH